MGWNLMYYRETDSTNLRAVEAAKKGAPHGTVIVADMQTAGRGRRGRKWESPAGANLYFTLLLRPAFVPDKASMLTLVMAHAVAQAIEDKAGISCGIKWPNDIVVNGKKVCGILTEMQAKKNAIEYVVVGTGVNVKRQEFGPELREKATSLEAEAEREVDREALLASILERFEADYGRFSDALNLAGLMGDYNRMLVNVGRKVRVIDPKGEFEGISGGITKEGELLVEREDGRVEKIFAGEVSVRGICGYV